MGTRGFVSFVADGQTKTAYVHCDAYPSALGLDILAWLRSSTIPFVTEKARALRVVTELDEPTNEDIERLAPYYNPNVGGPSERHTWYQLLRETQGDPAAMLAAGVIESAEHFPADSLWAEWGYVVDFDTQVFELYRGFQREPHQLGRFADMPPRDNDYWPVALVESWPLDALPSDDQLAPAED